jgi:hypothetical protein
VRLVYVQGHQHFCITCMSMKKQSIILISWPQYSMVHDTVTHDTEHPLLHIFTHSYLLLDLRCVLAGIFCCTHCIDIQSGVTKYAHGVSSCCIFVDSGHRVWKIIKTYVSCDFACSYWQTDINFVVMQRSFMDCMGMLRT